MPENINAQTLYEIMRDDPAECNNYKGMGVDYKSLAATNKRKKGETKGGQGKMESTSYDRSERKRIQDLDNS